MPAKTLTDRFVKTVLPPEKDRIDYFDALVQGLALRVSSSGKKSWCVIYRSVTEVGPAGGGKLRRYTLGPYPLIGLAAAREMARELLLRTRKGEDPQYQKIAARKAPRAMQTDPVTVKEGARRYIEEHVKVRNKPQHRSGERKFWSRQFELERYVIPELGDLRLSELRRKNVLAMQRFIEQTSGRTTSDRAAEALRSCLNWLADNELVEDVPTIRLRKKDNEATGSSARHRVLSGDEIAAVWRALDGDDGNFATIVKLLLLTGQRRPLCQQR